MYYDYFMYYLSYFSSLYNGYPLIIRMTVIMVMILMGITIMSIIRLLFIGYRINREQRRIEKARKQFEEKLNFVLKNKTIYDVGEIQQLLEYDGNKKNKWNPEVLTNLILSVKKTLSKEGVLNVINFKNCLETLGLMRFWEKRTRISSAEKRKEALQVVGEFDNGVNSGALSKSTFHKDDSLRKTARDLYTSQDTYNPFRFMEDNFDESFTQLDKLRLHSTLIKRSTEGKLPNLLRWMNNSRNPNYIIFVLREIGFFRQQGATSTLLSYLEKQENHEIRAQIVLTLGELGDYESISYLISRYQLEQNSVREAIIYSMGKLKTKESLDFLVETYRSTEDANSKLLIARSIVEHGREGEQALLRLKGEVEKKEEGILFEQVLSEMKFVTV